MGAASSVEMPMHNPARLKVYQEVKAEYEADVKNGMDEEEALVLYKEKYEQGVAAIQYEEEEEEVVDFSEAPVSRGPLAIGDIVRQKDWGTEGIIIERTENGQFVVDRGNLHVEVDESELTLVVGGLECEMNDKVQAKPVGSAMWYTGHIIGINLDDNGRTYNVEMMGDPDDVEYDVPEKNVRKLLSHRLIRRKLQKLVKTIQAVGAFNMGKASSKSPRRPDGEESVTAAAATAAGEGDGDGEGAREESKSGGEAKEEAAVQ